MAGLAQGDSVIVTVSLSNRQGDISDFLRVHQYRSRIKWPKFLLYEFSRKDMLTSVEIFMTTSRTLTEKRTTDRLMGDMQ
jgi:hypothetical protein